MYGRVNSFRAGERAQPGAYTQGRGGNASSSRSASENADIVALALD
jgi:hypothetical protein